MVVPTTQNLLSIAAPAARTSSAGHVAVHSAHNIRECVLLRCRHKRETAPLIAGRFAFVVSPAETHLQCRKVWHGSARHAFLPTTVLPKITPTIAWAPIFEPGPPHGLRRHRDSERFRRRFVAKIQENHGQTHPRGFRRVLANHLAAVVASR